MNPPPSKPQEPAVAPVRLAVERPRARILYAEDDPALRTLGQRLLMQTGFEVTTAVDGPAAWAALHASHYDLLVTDNEMPHLSGIELIRMLRQAGMTMPVILISGTFDALSPVDLVQVECDAKLAKPFMFQQLCAVIHELLQAASVRQPTGVQVPTAEGKHVRTQPQ